MRNGDHLELVDAGEVPGVHRIEGVPVGERGGGNEGIEGAGGRLAGLVGAFGVSLAACTLR
jgi:hypothetical protein